MFHTETEKTAKRKQKREWVRAGRVEWRGTKGLKFYKIRTGNRSR